MPGMFDGFQLNIFDDNIFDTKIQDVPTIRLRTIVNVPPTGQNGEARIVIEIE